MEDLAFVPFPRSYACHLNESLLGSVLVAIIAFLVVACPGQAAAQQPTNAWTASWITHPTAPLRDPGVFHFRKLLELKNHPTRFVVHVSADNRFILFVNGQRVGDGPARSDLHHWHYETFDLAPFLAAGRNVVAATVFHFGIYAPLAQVSDRLAFLLQSDSTAEAALNTDPSWEVEQEPGHTPIRALPEGLWEYFAAGPGERIDGTLCDWNWLTANSTSGRWVNAGLAIRESIDPRVSRPVLTTEGGDSFWWLMPDPLPPMEFTEVPSGHVVRSSTSAQTFPNSPVTIPPNTDAALLLDAGVVLSAYPELIVSGGKGSHINLTYTEALYDSKQLRGNRNEVGDRVVLGVHDEFIPDGGENRTFMPLWWRTWRYVELRVHTADAPITLATFRTYYTAYPFTEKGKFASSDPQLEKIREISWRTARLDAHDTYMDTAYWEQLQYIGDTRIQALISYAVSGDDRLARQAMLAFDRSRIPEGITQSRYPSSLLQLIPPFSLLYIDMLHDYWMYRPDVDFLKDRLPGTRPVLAWFEQRQRSDGFLGALPYWNFVDTPPGLEKFPPMDSQGRSSILTLQFVRSLLDAAEMEDSFGDPTAAARYRREADMAGKAVYAACWNRDLGLLADTPDKNTYSQHANALAVLTDVVPQKDQAQLMQKIFSEISGMAHASYFFQFYITRALDHAGMGDSYLRTLDPWRHMLEQGLTTTPEYPDPSRSDTHAWSAHPAYDLPTMIAGIRPGSPGFATVRIEPHLGDLQWVEASVPHPAGMIHIFFRRTGESVKATIELPPGISGVLAWRGVQHALHAGAQQLTLP